MFYHLLYKMIWFWIALGLLHVAAMKEIRNVSCSEICTDGSCTYQISAGVRTGEHCDHAWMAEDEMVLAPGSKNLILSYCRKEIHFVTRCDTADDHIVTYRGFNTTQDPITTVDPSVNGTTSDPNTIMALIGISIVLIVVIVFIIGLFITNRLKMSRFKGVKGPNCNGGENIPMV